MRFCENGWVLSHLRIGSAILSRNRYLQRRTCTDKHTSSTAVNGSLLPPHGQCPKVTFRRLHNPAGTAWKCEIWSRTLNQSHRVTGRDTSRELWLELERWLELTGGSSPQAWTTLTFQFWPPTHNHSVTGEWQGHFVTRRSRGGQWQKSVLFSSSPPARGWHVELVAVFTHFVPGRRVE
jgi:hypothetical protein